MNIEKFVIKKECSKDDNELPISQTPDLNLHDDGKSISVIEDNISAVSNKNLDIVETNGNVDLDIQYNNCENNNIFLQEINDLSDCGTLPILLNNNIINCLIDKGPMQITQEMYPKDDKVDIFLKLIILENFQTVKVVVVVG